MPENAGENASAPQEKSRVDKTVFRAKVLMAVGIFAVLLSASSYVVNQERIQAGLNCQYITLAKKECEAFPHQVWVDRCEYDQRFAPKNDTLNWSNRVE